MGAVSAWSSSGHALPSLSVRGLIGGWGAFSWGLGPGRWAFATRAIRSASIGPWPRLTGSPFSALIRSGTPVSRFGSRAGGGWLGGRNPLAELRSSLTDRFRRKGLHFHRATEAAGGGQFPRLEFELQIGRGGFLQFARASQRLLKLHGRPAWAGAELACDFSSRFEFHVADGAAPESPDIVFQSHSRAAHVGLLEGLLLEGIVRRTGDSRIP